jgi:hypothetical protein
MNKKLKVEWLEALRFGRYTQAQGVLRRDNSFCCLGVLCDLQGAQWGPADGHGDRNAMAGVDTDYLMPAVFDGGLTDTQQTHLSQLNDRGESFKRIANYIEESIG